jgi:glycosyltransferase involved in cell wall biosynthesis
LVEAFIELKGRDGLGGIKLRIAGGSSAADAVFINGLKDRLTNAGCLGDVVFLADFVIAGRLEFLNSLTVLSVPERRGVAYGLYAIEANACGTPVAEPATGVFVEMLDKTAGGVLYEPSDVSSLVEALEALLSDREKAFAMGQKGREGVLKHYNVYDNAAKMIEIFQGLSNA